MNFVKQVEEQLRDLGTESRNKHPGVKEASERAILSLRLLQNKYVAAVRQATRSIGDVHKVPNHSQEDDEEEEVDDEDDEDDGEVVHKGQEKEKEEEHCSGSSRTTRSRIAHPTTQMFQSQDILRPFLLAANYPNVGNRILQLSLDGIQTLLAGQAICKQDGVHVVRVLYIQANVCAAAIYGKNSTNFGLLPSSSSSSSHGVMSVMENYINIPSAGSVVNAGMGTISHLGSSILSGFGFKSGGVASGMMDHGERQQTIAASLSESESGGGATVDHGRNESGATAATTNAAASADHSTRPNFVHHKRSVGSAAHASHRTVKEDEGISIRILQLVAIMIGSEEIELSEELLSQCIGICLVLGACVSSDAYISEEEQRHRVNSVGKMNKGNETNIFKIHGGRSLRKKDGGHHGGSRAQNVSSVASATFRQIISTLFSRVATVATTTATDACDDVKPTDSNLTIDNESLRIQSLAANVLSDLCCLAECTTCNGPIGHALVGQQRKVAKPSLYMCFSLMDMILDNHFDLFVMRGTVVEDDSCFKTLLKDRIFPLVTKLIANVGKENNVADTSNCEDLPSLALMLKLTIMATSIVTKYCHESSLEKQCQNLIMAIGTPIKSATILLRDSHDFEDGFVYSTDTIDEVKHETEHEKDNIDERFMITLWAATISIEAIYSLISKHFQSMLPLFLSKEDHSAEDSLLSSVISIMCDFSVVASSSKPSISKLVLAAESDEEYQEEEVLDEVEDLESVHTVASGQGNYRDVFLREESFAIRRIHPAAVTHTKSMAEYNLGGTAWIAMNCIVLSWRCFQTCNLNEEDKLQLVGGCFGPSLVVIQHFLRRCPASEIICRSSLSAYLCLSRTLLPIKRNGDSRREVILASLCKLALSSLVDHDSRKLLRPNIMAMSLLFEVLYYNANDITADWLIVLKCLAKISELKNSGSNAEKNIEFNLSRIGRLSAFLHNEALNHLVSALIILSQSDDKRGSSAHTSSFGRTIYQNAVGNLQTTRFNTKSDELQNVAFPLVALFIVSVENYGRFDCFGDSAIQHFSSQASENKSSVVRKFALDVISHSIVSVLASGTESNEIRQKMLIEPFCVTIQRTNFIDTAELGVTKLKQILEDGHDLSAAWPLIIKTLTTIANSSHDIGDWAICCSTAFACLKLMVDDFLNEPPEQEITRVELLDCCAAFCSSRFDINTSLTAIGMLWSIADQDSSSSSVDHVLSKLAHLAADDRVEVRNCVVNTLFSCIVGLGHSLNSTQWQEIFTNTIFAVLDQVKDQRTAPHDSTPSDSSHENKIPDRYKVSVHHSRDSISKQWATTQVLTLRGIERVLRHYFVQLLYTFADGSDSKHFQSKNIEKNWFAEAWYRILEQCLTCSKLLGGREYLDLRLAGVELLILCCQTSSRRGFVAADVRVGTNMQVVNGALRSVRSTSSGSSLLSPGTRSPKVMDVEHIDPALIEIRSMLFEYAFDCLCQLKNFLKDHETDIRGDGNIDSVHIQVLTRLGQGLAQLFESCKGNELSLTHQGGEKERIFVDLVSLIMTMSRGNQRSKFLTQAQRPCLDLLKTMSLNGSSCAFEVIVTIGSKIVLTQTLESDYDVLQVEAGKIISEICSNNNVSVELQRTNYGVIVTVDLVRFAVGAEKRKDDENTSGKEADKNHNAESIPTDGEVEFLATEPSIQHNKDSDIIQLKEINAQLMLQVEKLQSQKEKLEQQVAVLSEGTAYI